MTNPYIAGVTTAHARPKLYDYCLGKLGTRAVYCDTDSIKYTVSDTEKPLKNSDNLGDLKDKLKGGSFKKFIASGPKSNAHINNRDEIETHIKGITLNVRNLEKMTFEIICKVIDGDIEKITTHYPDHFSRSHDKKGVSLCELNKDFRFNFDKRVVQSGFTTLLCGY